MWRSPRFFAALRSAADASCASRPGTFGRVGTLRTVGDIGTVRDKATRPGHEGRGLSCRASLAARLSQETSKKTAMLTRYVVAAAVAAAFLTPALAAEFFIVQDTSTKRCQIVEQKPPSS